MNLSEHFTLEEATISQTASRLGIDNTPPPAALRIMQIMAVKMELLRELLGNPPIQISSWYRSPELNAAVGGVKNSQHILGEAVDFICPAIGTPADVCKAILEQPYRVSFDQLILEHTWVHISFAITTRQPRTQVLSLLENKSYSTGLTDKKGNPIT